VADFQRIIFLAAGRTGIRFSGEFLTDSGVHEADFEIDHYGPVKIRPDFLFRAFSTKEHLGDHRFSNYSSIYQLLILFSIFFCGIIKAYIFNATIFENVRYEHVP